MICFLTQQKTFTSHSFSDADLSNFLECCAFTFQGHTEVIRKMKLKVVFRDKFLACHVYTWYECEVYEHDDEHNAVSNLTYYLTLSLPQCHLKMTNKSVKFEIL